MARRRRLHPEYELDEDGNPLDPEPVVVGDDLLARLAEPLPPSQSPTRRGAQDHSAKAWFMQRGFFCLVALGIRHKALTPIYREATGASGKDVPSPRTVARWWAEWSQSKARRGAPSNPGRDWFRRKGFAMQERHGWTDRQLRVEYEATAHVPPYPSDRTLRRWKRAWLQSRPGARRD